MRLLAIKLLHQIMEDTLMVLLEEPQLDLAQQIFSQQQLLSNGHQSLDARLLTDPLMRPLAMMLDHQSILNSMMMLSEEPQWVQPPKIFFQLLLSLILLLNKLLISLVNGHLLLDVMKMVFHQTNGLVIMPTSLDSITTMELLDKLQSCQVQQIFSQLQHSYKLILNLDQKSNAETQFTDSQFLVIGMIPWKLHNFNLKMFTT